jgi:DUF4097 and DUF4098 domain-containing protein YvlB
VGEDFGLNIRAPAFANHSVGPVVRNGAGSDPSTPEISMRRLSAALILTAATSFVPTFAASAQASSHLMDNCSRSWGDDNARFCEERNFNLTAGQSLNVDARSNGGVTVHGWDKNQIQVVAVVQAQAESEAEAQTLARSVNVSANGSDIHADGPRTSGRDHQSWSVSYEIWAPRHTNLTLASTNGGLAVDAMDAKVQLETVNGGLNISNVSGDVHGTTSNGGITAHLTGDRWNGAGLDLRTSNGGVRLFVPENYSANLETGTTNGSLNLGFPVTVQGTYARHVTTQLGAGGAPIRAMTTNGGVSISRE